MKKYLKDKDGNSVLCLKHNKPMYYYGPNINGHYYAQTCQDCGEGEGGQATGFEIINPSKNRNTP